MKLLHFLYLILLLISLGCKDDSKHHELKIKIGKHGCIPNTNILLNDQNEFEEIISNRKHFIKFLGATIHEFDNTDKPTGATHEEGIIYFRSDNSSLDIWNTAISGKTPEELKKLEVGIESPLMTPFLAKYYFEKVSIWIDRELVYTNVEPQSD